MLIYQTEAPEVAYMAFNELFRRFSQRVFSYLLLKTRNNADAEDLVQKVFMKIHESKHLYKPEFKFEQWLFVIARTSLIDQTRVAQKREKKHEAYFQNLEEVPQEQEIELGFMNNLNESDKELLNLKFIDEYSYQEIAKRLNKSEVSLRKTVSRLIGKLRKEEVYE